jgi:N6-L-threonylcarbamoyladenine synthase
MFKKDVLILGIESSCDDTAAAIIHNDNILANVISGQHIHSLYGGVVPELASRAHQQNIIPVVDQALLLSKVNKKDLSAVAFTKGPGLMGSLLVGISFAKSFALALELPLIEINHMHAHIMAHFINRGENYTPPGFPFLCLTVSGGHTQIVRVNSHLNFEVIGETLDDAAGEAFDKAAKILGLSYPGGPLIDMFGKDGDPLKFLFPKTKVPNLNFSFSGIKTSFLYFIRDQCKKEPAFIKDNLADICASIQYAIVSMLIEKVTMAADQTGIKEIAIAGGVSVNSALRELLMKKAYSMDWNIHIAPGEYCTDNAAMIAMAGYYKFLAGETVSQNVSALPRYNF